MRDKPKTIGIIGFGNMGSAIAEQLKSKYQICVFDKDKNKTKNILDLQVVKDNADLVNRVDTVILAVKPQDVDGVLKEIKSNVKDKLIISIAAGISTEYIEKRLGQVRIIRAMPNIGIKIGESVTCLCRGVFVTESDLDFAKELFYYLGIDKEIEEKLMNAATAISGSGPAYIFDFIESNLIDPNNIAQHLKQDIIKRLAQAAESIGFNHEDAIFLAVNTTNTSINLIKKTKISPAELKKQVTSKGGTTEAALEALHKGGSWEEVAKAALKRAEELSRED